MKIIRTIEKSLKSENDKVRDKAIGLVLGIVSRAKFADMSDDEMDMLLELFQLAR